MKYLYLSIAAVAIMSLSLTSCSSNTDINVDDLETVCDHINAVDDIATEMLDIRGEGKVEDMDSGDKEHYDKLDEKLEEVETVMMDKFKKKDAKECPDFKLAMRKMKDLRKD